MQNQINILEKKNSNLNFLPTDPGIYRFLDSEKEVIYIGKAKNLRKRIKSYFLKSKVTSNKLKRLTSETLFLDLTVTISELEALLLEQHLIKELKPKYNVQFKDDKGYPWIKISTSNEFPSAVSYLGKKDDGELYFGPFPSSYAVKNTLKIIQKIFKIRDCKDSFFKNRKRPCLQHEIGRCSAPCVEEISKKEYIKEVNQAKDILKGRGDNLLDILYLEMDKYSENKAYEKAAEHRNKISSLREIQRDQSIAGHTKDRDAISISRSGTKIKIGVTSVRGGWIISHKNFTQEKNLLNEGVIDSFLSSYYTSVDSCPDIILLKERLVDKQTIQIALSGFHKRKVIITNTLKNKDIGLMKISQANTNLYLNKKRKNRDVSEEFALLKGRLGLKHEIKLIESYDISHFSGENATAGQVSFDNEGRVNDLYRTYNISKKNSGNDIGSMQEVIERRFSKRDMNLTHPSIILIDGGHVHLKAVRKVLRKLNIDEIYLLSISKGARRKKELDQIHTEKGEKMSLKNNSKDLILLQEIRDETHRFTITKQRNKESKKVTKSSLDAIKFIGKERKKALLRFFGSFNQIEKASPRDLMKVRGIGKITADLIFRNLH